MVLHSDKAHCLQLDLIHLQKPNKRCSMPMTMILLACRRFRNDNQLPGKTRKSHMIMTTTSWACLDNL